MQNTNVASADVDYTLAVILCIEDFYTAALNTLSCYSSTK